MADNIAETLERRASAARKNMPRDLLPDDIRLLEKAAIELDRLWDVIDWIKVYDPQLINRASELFHLEPTWRYLTHYDDQYEE